MLRTRTSLLLSSICALLLVFGCGRGEESRDLGDWTLTTDGGTLEKDLQVSETGNYFFGSIEDLAVTNGGRMLVLDGEANHLKVLRPDGTLMDTLGRAGRGPGEFQRPASVAVARGDSMYVFDNQLNRLTVFTPPPSAEQARSVTITSAVGSATEVQVVNGALVGRVTPGYTRTEGLRRPSPATWRLLSETGVLGDTVLLSKRRRLSTSFQGGVTIGYLPFGRVTRVAAGPDGRLYHGFTDRLQISATSLDGTTEDIANVPAEPIPVTETERDSALERIPSQIQRPIESAFPDTKPALTDLVVADDGRLWGKRPTEGPDADTAPWWILDPETKTIRQAQLPVDADLEVVKNGRAYGQTTTGNGAPALVRYRILESSN